MRVLGGARLGGEQGPKGKAEGARERGVGAERGVPTLLDAKDRGVVKAGRQRQRSETQALLLSGDSEDAASGLSGAHGRVLIKHHGPGPVKQPATHPPERGSGTLQDMAETRVRKLGRGRYDPYAIARRVETLRRDRGLSIKEVALKVWPHQGDDARHSWSKKCSGKGSAWTIEELGVAADALDAPPGWPFLSDEFSRLVQRWVDAAKP